MMTLEFFPYPFLVGLAGLFLVLLILRRRQKPGAYLFFFAVFWVYLLIIAAVTLFPIPIGAVVEREFWPQSLPEILSYVNLVSIFNPIRHPLSKYVILYEVIGNVLLTIPFGFGILFVAPAWAKRIPWLALFIGLVIETTQLILKVFFGSYRVTDINDVVLNALGVWIGYGIFRVFAWAYRKIRPYFTWKPGGLVRYLDRVIGRVGRRKHPIVERPAG